MTLDEQDALLDRLTVLAEYYEKPKSPAALMVYIQALDDVPYAAIGAALEHHVKHGFPTFPKVSDIRRFIEGESEGQADDGWAELHSEIRRVGSWRAPTLSKVAEETMLLLCGSWERCVATIGRAEGPELLGWQKRWKDSYGHTAGKLDRGELISRDDARQILAAIPKQLPDADQRAVSPMPAGVSAAGDVSDARRTDDGRQLLQPMREELPTVSGGSRQGAAN